MTGLLTIDLPDTVVGVTLGGSSGAINAVGGVASGGIAGVFTDISASGQARIGYGDTGIYGYSASAIGKGVHAFQYASSGYAVYAEGGKSYFAGKVGIGTIDPGTSKLKVIGGDVYSDGGLSGVCGTLNRTCVYGEKRLVILLFMKP